MNHRTPRIHPLRTALALALAIGTAQAQTAPGIGDAMRQAQPPAMPAPPTPALPAVGGAPLAPPLQALPGGPSVEVRALRITGNREIATETLLAQLQGEAGKRFTLPELEALATRLTLYYRTQGYFVARAYVPAQALDDGTLTLTVVEGNYGQFILDNQSRVRDDTVQGLLDDVKRYDIVSLDTLERAMLIINDTPGARVVRADVMPGQRVGTSDFAIGTTATPAVNGYALLDNHGSVYTGKTRLSGHLDWNSPSGRGDRLSASGMVTGRNDLNSGRLAYSALVATNGTRTHVAASRTRYELGDVYRTLGATGTADTLEFGLTTPFKRTRATSIEGGLTLAARRMRDEIATSATVMPKHSYSVTASLDWRSAHRLGGLDGVSAAGVSLTAGRLGFNDAAAKALDAAGARTQGSYSKLNLNLSRATQLPAGFTLNTSAKVQVALSGRNLDGSERLGVSGSSGVWAYPIGELSGDHAALVRLELSRALPSTGSLHWTASVFADYGWARAVKPQGGMGDARTIGDIGLGLGLALPNGGLAKLQVAHRTTGGAPRSEPTSRTVARLMAGWVF